MAREASSGLTFSCVVLRLRRTFNSVWLGHHAAAVRGPERVRSSAGLGSQCSGAAD